ncbi:NmrA-like family protein [Micromonospora pisi]|uniref:NmrA-like family protein n=1 Tax=Micromonospora pisi TaxID=589240 RepID=A0A495JHZ0_9ACTN|nr:NmrA family NAD(P)-binding protein [Micromonospora pisi]RKR88391.1 NmrA-like family protein [Micromonospora pisi]
MTDLPKVVTVLGATRNFFKVGHYTLRRLACDAPQLTLRLAIPEARIAGRAVSDIEVQLREWEPAEPASLAEALAGTETMLMVPPIDRRVDIGGMYLQAAQRAGVQRIVCLGIQFAPEQCTMADEAAALEALLEKSGIAFDVVQLPMFLENILYQCQSIAGVGSFTFPVDADRPFSYISCDDAAALFCRKILSPDSVDLSSALMSHHTQATCAQWASALSQVCGRPITFVRQTDEHFVTSLAKYGIRRSAAAQVLGLWGRIGAEGDAPATRTAEQLLGRPSTDLETWTTDHACCFGPDFTSCPHPHPPIQHMFGPA